MATVLESRPANDSLTDFEMAGHRYRIADLTPWLEGQGASLPFSLRVLLENIVRHAGADEERAAQIAALTGRKVGTPIAFRPARVLLQDLLGVPLLADLAAFRDVVAANGGDPRTINPVIPSDLIIDHSLRVDRWASPTARAENLALEHARNEERFAFLRWCQLTFDNLRVVPPGKGIMHQINLEHLARVVWTGPDGRTLYPDTLVGTDSHTTMINGLGVLGWGVGGIEAEAGMLGRALSITVPEIVGVELTGAMPEGVTATDLVLTVTERLRALGVVGCFVEFFGRGLARLSLGDRATIANMTPEYGATSVFFPVDRVAIDYLKATGRAPEQVALVESYCRRNGLWWSPDAAAPRFERTITIDLSRIAASLAGPRRPEDRVELAALPANFETFRAESAKGGPRRHGGVASADYEMKDGDVVIAAITSCTNTSNPASMAVAGLVARRARERGLKPKPWVKTSMTPGSQVTAALLEDLDLQDDLDALGFHVAGFGCGTCNGMSGPLPAELEDAIETNGVTATAVLSGNRNFEGRIHPNVRAAYLASPGLVVAYALAGTVDIDLTTMPIGLDRDGEAVFLADLWPTGAEVAQTLRGAAGSEEFAARYADVFEGDSTWKALPSGYGDLFAWRLESTYIRRPPWFEDGALERPAAAGFRGMRPLAILGDSITTDHISPSGAIARDSAAARFLVARGVAFEDFNSYGTRRGNHEVVVRATYANIRLRNRMTPGREGSLTRLMPDGVEMSIFEATEEYRRRGVPLVVFAGSNYGCGSSRDSAAKGVALVGIRVVIAESFERIHRTNLVGMGVLPLELLSGTLLAGLGLDGAETIDLDVDVERIGRREKVPCHISFADGRVLRLELTARLDTPEEVAYWRAGGILPFVRDEMASRRA